MWTYVNAGFDVVLGQQIVDAACWMVGDARDGVAQPSLGIDAAQLGALDQGLDRGGTLAALVGAGEQLVLATKGDAAECAFGGIVVDLETTIVEVAAERLPS
jgi:hypothetical protein